MFKKLLMFLIAAWHGIWQEILARFEEDISGKTLNEYTYVKMVLRPEHPFIADVLDALMAFILRPIMYWLAFGVIFILGPWGFALASLCWHNFITALIAMLVAVFIDAVFIYPYLKEKAAGVKDIS